MTYAIQGGPFGHCGSPKPGATVDFHFLLALVLSPGVLAGFVTITKHRQWLHLVRHVYDHETAEGRTVDPIALLETAKNPRAARP
ncbi:MULTISPECIES: hypothetical protein [Protofrankia]|uniref:hypothetical protein n=1 Tax=Protofrankia TaxID=2994361 RepID=UPI001040EE74|nr:MULTISPECIES: hypothetical protein [Protofrankia]